MYLTATITNAKAAVKHSKKQNSPSIILSRLPVAVATISAIYKPSVALATSRKNTILTRDLGGILHKNILSVGAKHSGDNICILTNIFLAECFALPRDNLCLIN